MDETEEHTRKSIKKLIELGVSIETIADRLDLDIDFTTMVPILSDLISVISKLSIDFL